MELSEANTSPPGKSHEFWSSPRDQLLLPFIEGQITCPPLPPACFLDRQIAGTAWHTKIRAADSKQIRRWSSKEDELTSLVNCISHCLAFDDLPFGAWVSCLISNSSCALYVCPVSSSELSILLFDQNLKKWTLFRHCHFNTPNLSQQILSLDYFFKCFYGFRPRRYEFWTSDIWC